MYVVYRYRIKMVPDYLIKPLKQSTFPMIGKIKIDRFFLSRLRDALMEVGFRTTNDILANLLQR